MKNIKNITKKILKIIKYQNTKIKVQDGNQIPKKKGKLHRPPLRFLLKPLLFSRYWKLYQ